MATRDFQASWVDVYSESGGWSKINSSHPLRIGGSANHQSFIRIPDEVKNALNSSLTTPQLHMRIYVNSARSEIDIGNHNHSNSRSTGSRGIPSYSYNETWRNISFGWNSYQMTNWFLPQFLAGNVKGVVLYNPGFGESTAQGIGVSNYVRFRVTGEWGDIAVPSVPRVSSSRPELDSTLTIWTDRSKDTLTHTLKYSLGSASGTIETGIEESVKWTLPDSLGDQMPNSTSRTGTLTLETYENGSRIGTRTANFTAVVPNNEKYRPNLSNFTWSVAGDGYDAQIGVPIQGQSRIQASFWSGGVYGASISSNSIKIGNTFPGREVTSHVLQESGPITITAETYDTRGFRTRDYLTIERYAYAEPEVTRFEFRRTSGSNVRVRRAGNWSSLDGNNNLNIKVQAKLRDEPTWTTYHETNGTSGTFDLEVDISGIDELRSHDIRVLVRDDLGSEALSLGIIGTAAVSSSEGPTGFGAGKIWERGALDVGEGGVYFDHIRQDYSERFDPRLGSIDNLDFWQQIPQGRYFVGRGHLSGQPSDFGVMEVSKGATYDFSVVWYAQGQGRNLIYRKSGNNNSMTDWEPFFAFGDTNSNGTWTRHPDGTQTCWINDFLIRYDTSARLAGTWTFPESFVSTPTVMAIRDARHSAEKFSRGTLSSQASSTSRGLIRMFPPLGLTYSAGDSEAVHLFATGRWRW